MKYKTFLFVISMGLLIISCGCQSTPVKEVVVNKGDGHLEAMIQSTPVPITQNLIEEDTELGLDQNGEIQSTLNWVETYTFPGLNCEIDAEIKLPEISMFPVYKVQKRIFDIDLVTRIINYFTSSATGVCVTSPTKEELTQQLVIARRGTYVLDDDGGRWESYEGQEQVIANIEEQIKKSEDEVYYPISTEPIVLPVSNTYLMEDGAKVCLDVKTESIFFTTEKLGIIQLESWVINGEARPGEAAGTTIDNIKISEQVAYEKAYSLLESLGINNFGIAEIEKARMVHEYSADTITEGWNIILTRNDGDCIPVFIWLNQISGLLFFSTEEYAPRWMPESISLFIDEAGISSMRWDYPLDVVEVMNSNVEIKKFSDVKEDILKMIRFGFSQREAQGHIGVNNTIAVRKIVLTNLLVPLKDELDFHMLVPVWVVYYEQEIGNAGIYTSAFAINAIDGSSVDLSHRKELSPEMEEFLEDFFD